MQQRNINAIAICFALIGTLLFLLINTVDIDLQYFWYDEGYTLIEITGILTPNGLNLPAGVVLPGQTFLDLLMKPGSFANIADTLYVHDVHPPLYFQTIWAWAHVFGTSNEALRFFSQICVVLAAWIVFIYAYKRYQANALLTFALLIGSSSAAYAAINARGYAMALILVALVLLTLLASLQRANGWKLPLAAGLLTSAAIMTHYFTLLTLGPIGMVTFAFYIARKRWGAVAAACAGVAPGLLLAGLVWLPHHIGARASQMAGFQKPIFESLLLVINLSRQFFPYALSHPGFVVPALLTVFFLFMRWGIKRWRTPEIAIPFFGIIGTLIGFFLLFWLTDKTMAHPSMPRYMIFVLPSMALLLPAMLENVKHKKWAFALIAVPFSLLVFSGGIVVRNENMDQPWANTPPNLTADMQLRVHADKKRLVVLQGTEPGMIGAALPALDPTIDTLYAPQADALDAVLQTGEHDVVFMRPIPWANQDIPTEFKDVLMKHGFSDTPYLRGTELTWKK